MCSSDLMRDQYALGFVDVGGWDTHVAQGGATGYLASRLDELGQGVAAFAQEMGPQWRNTVVVVMSEFGRTLDPAAGGGSDHAWGNHWFALGGMVKGGKVYGQSQARNPNAPRPAQAEGNSNPNVPAPPPTAFRPSPEALAARVERMTAANVAFAPITPVVQIGRAHV